MLPIEYNFPLQRQLVEDAIAEFNQNEQYLLEVDLSERCICARFAMYLEKQLRACQADGYHADVEYNRGKDGVDRNPKRLYDAPITVDLIVHKRGHDNRYGYKNMICIEMKKSTNRRGCTADEDRLCKLTGTDYGFCYQSGFMLLADMTGHHLKIKRAFHCGAPADG